MTGNKSLDALLFVAITFLFGVVFSFISEVTHKRRSPRDVANDYKQVLGKFSKMYIVFILACIVYSCFAH